MENYNLTDKNKCIEIGYNLLEEHKFDDALDIFKELNDIYNDDSDTLAGLAYAYFSLDNVHKAIEVAKNALNADPDNCKAHLLLCEIYSIKYSKYSEAEKHGLKAIEIEPNNSFGYSLLAQLYFHLGKYPDSYDYAKKSIELNPGDEVGYMTLANYCMEYNFFMEAENYYLKALTVSPHNPMIIHNMGVFYLKLAKSPGGHEEIKKSMRKNASNKELQEILKNAYILSHPGYRIANWLSNGFVYWLLIVPMMFICAVGIGSMASICPMVIVLMLFTHYCRYKIGKKFDQEITP